jgi:cobalt/nickel transport system permease protein
VAGTPLDAAAWASPWRRRSPGDKLALGLGLMVCALLLPVWPGSPIVAAVAVGLALGPARVRWRVLVAAAAGPATFILLGAVGIAVTWRAGTGWPVPAVTGAGLGRAAATGGHAVAGTAAMLLLATTTPISDLVAWAGRRGVPAAVVDVAQLTYRLLFLLLDAAVQVRAAQVARLGYGTRRAAVRSAGMLVTVVLVRAWDRAHRLEEGLAGRGYEGSLAVLDDPRPSSPRFVAATVGLLAGIVVLSLLTAGRARS